MDRRVYLFMVISFIVGMVELIISGILDLIVADLHITFGQAGLLITVFSLIFAIAAPILLIATAHIERKRLIIISLVVFLIGNIIAIVSPSYTILMVSRIVSAASGSLLTVLCITVAASIVREKYIGRAIGIVVMGVSGSLVLGVPIGLLLGHQFTWRAPFILIALLTVILMGTVYFSMSEIAPEPAVPLRKQLATLKNNKILFAHLTTFLFLAGHFTFYAYFTPFLNIHVGITGSWVSVIYFIFGVAAVTGGGFGGLLTDKFGSKRVVLFVIVAFAISLFVLPHVASIMTLLIFAVIAWGVMNWAITPPMHSYLIETAPEAAATHQSLNNSALHFGIAFGSFVGSFVIEHAPVTQNATVGTVFVVLALCTAIFSFTRKQMVASQSNV